MQEEKVGILKVAPIKNEKVILALYIIVLICGILMYSTVPFKQVVRYIWRSGIILLFICSVIFQRHSSRQWEVFLILSSVCMISYIFYKVNMDFFYISLIIFGMGNILPREILSVSAKTIFLIILCLTICSCIHLIPNLIFYRDGTMRLSLGTIYPLTYASLIFFGCAAWTSICENNLKNILLLGILAAYIFIVNGARNDTINMVLLIFACLSDHFNHKINKYLSLIGTFLVYGICIISIFITDFLPYYSNTYAFLNSLFNGRLGFQYTLTNFYHPTFWGQIIPQMGLGGTTTTVSNYFYIDNSYVRLLFMNGIVLTILIICLIYNLIFNLYKLGLYKQVYIVLIVMISGITEDSLVNGAINIFFYILLTTSMNLKDSFKTQEYIKNRGII